MPPAVTPAVAFTDKPKNKKIVFDDDGEILNGDNQRVHKSKKIKLNGADEDEFKDKTDHSNLHTTLVEEEEEEEDYFAKRDKAKQKQKDENDEDSRKKWFNVFPEFPKSAEILDMKESEQLELFGLCKSAFVAEQAAFAKRNPSDARWLQTALHKGTAKDRANAGALLVTSNPLGNLTALTALIGFSKLSNKSSSEIIGILTDLWLEVLLPPHRKLISIPMRGADWKEIRRNTELSKESQRRIYAYWHFENELKDQYFEFLKNLQHGIQTGQENNKNASIIAASQLLAYGPEKEQMLLTMLINKLGDPIAKIASKALHHLSEIALKHPNMCGVIVTETEKLLFRNNISDRAQHFALCFLATIAPAGRPEVCTKLVHICFSLFKVLVQKGAVNNRTMQAILRCLQKAIIEAKPANGSTEIMTKEMQDTIYRLVHLADIRISVQTLSLLLQIIAVKTENSDRFYNALYKKMLDLEVTSVGTKTAALLLHIIHRAIHIDVNVPRMHAFIKRLLQIALFLPPSMSCGCLIVIHKLFRSRKELLSSTTDKTDINKCNGLIMANVGGGLPYVLAEDEELAKFDSDGEEKYEDIKDDKHESKRSMNETNVGEKKEEDEEELKKSHNPSSWHHANIATLTPSKMSTISASKYDPYHRVASYAGAEYSYRSELLLLREHFHPTVQVFADGILNEKRIDYYGDPLRDFGLPHFLERFAFKNPKKLEQTKTETPTISHKRYVAYGTRGKPVKSLTKANCTEDEMFIFNYLEQKRMRSVASIESKRANNEDDLDLKPGEVNDDEFEEYLDGYFGKKPKMTASSEDEIDFLKELGGELKDDEKMEKKKLKPAKEDDEADIDDDWADEDVADEKFAGSDVSDDESGSINLEDDDEDDEDGSISLDEENNKESDNDELSESHSSDEVDDDDELLELKSKKSRKQTLAVDSRSFAKKLKHSDDMSSLFAAADDFAELLEETGKTKGQGTANAIFNKDKSSDKQLKWEEKRRSNNRNYSAKKLVGNKFNGRKSAGKLFAKKRKN